MESQTVLGRAAVGEVVLLDTAVPICRQFQVAEEWTEGGKVHVVHWCQAFADWDEGCSVSHWGQFDPSLAKMELKASRDYLALGLLPNHPVLTQVERVRLEWVKLS
jgi:hypothetical protein